MEKFKYLIFLPLLLGSCRDDSMHLDLSMDGKGAVLRIQAEIDQINLTRADDSGFADGDVIGLYAVDFVGGQPGKLTASGNNSDNIAFTFDESNYKWNSTKAILFADDKTPLDLYGYYPYSQDVDAVETLPITVEYNQNGQSKSRNMSAYEASDFLWAKASGISSSAPMATLYFKHVLSSVRVSLIEGNGFDEGEWASIEKSVIISNTSRDAVVNLSSGEVKITGHYDGRGIAAKKDSEDFRAIVIPQNVTAGSEILNITVGNISYAFKKDRDMTYFPTKQHNFTMKVNKKSSNGDYEFILVDEAITAWESDSSSHNGQAKEYIVVELSEVSTLESEIKKLGLTPSEITNLKIIGPMSEGDFEYIRTSLNNLEAINLIDVDLSHSEIYVDYIGEWGTMVNFSLPIYAFVGMTTLKTCVFPKNLKHIGAFAFYGTSLAGSLNIPDGVESIERFAFSNFYSEGSGYSEIPGGQMINHNNLTGELILPSSLKYIGGDAFRGCEFSGRLLLPEGLVTIGGAAFSDCPFFTGDLILPESLKIIEAEAFAKMTGLSGWISLPSHITELKGSLFSGTPIVNVEWPENLLSIQGSVFAQSDIKCEVRIPESVVSIGGDCFSSSNVKHVSLPSNITFLRSGIFANCKELSDTVHIPSKVEVIEGHAFDGCEKIEAVTLPSALQRIDEYAFVNCYNLQYIRCDALEPPMISDNVFWGVEKDNFTIEVPEQSVDAYRNAPGWSEFKRISAYRNFVARPSKYNVLNKGGKKEIILNADAEWEIIECPSWCHIDKHSGSKKTTLTLTVDAMAKGSPARNANITFKLKDNDNHLTHINVAQYDYELDEDQYITLQASSKGKGINLVFLGDGYDAADIAAGTYLADMKQEMEYLFGVEPYTSYREYFNVYTAIALSEDSGVESLNSWRNTKFHVCIGDGCAKDGQRLSADWIKALNYCAENVPPTIQGVNPQVGCIVVANSNIYEGVTYLGDSFCSVVTKSSEKYPNDARGLVQHEAGGHGIGWLADEYVYHKAFINSCSCTCCGHVQDLELDHAGGFALNVSLTGKPKEVPWSHLIFNPNYGDIVDVYEGGYFHSRGVYRSEYNSCMNNNVPYFSSWSRQLIVQRIMKLAGENFNLDSFYAKDSRDLGRDFTNSTRSEISGRPEANGRPGNHPIKITGYKYGKKGGKK